MKTKGRPRKYNQKTYKYYVVSKGKIQSGWDYKEDAKDMLEDLPISAGSAKIYKEAGLKKLGLNADDNKNWLTDKYMGNPQEGTLYIDCSSIFDYPETKYEAEAYMNVLKKSGADDVWKDFKYGWPNLPEVVLFTGLDADTARAALDEFPYFKKYGAIISNAHDHWKPDEEDEEDSPSPG